MNEAEILPYKIQGRPGILAVYKKTGYLFHKTNLGYTQVSRMIKMKNGKWYIKRKPKVINQTWIPEMNDIMFEAHQVFHGKQKPDPEDEMTERLKKLGGV